MCAYPHTKAIAEQAVLAANQPGSFETVALRPHLIWGNDDPHLLPRLVERARLGRLRIVGDGLNRVDTVHVANAAAAHLDALDALVSQPRESSGHAYFIAQDESVLCWDWIRQICELADVAPPHQRISYRSAYRLGTMLEWIYRVLGRKNEPPMTRFVAAQLATDHYFNITRAREQLQYRVRVSLAEGLAELSQGGRWRKSPAKTL
jgi:nucleoside-diphosphate-sugar epimerase